MASKSENKDRQTTEKVRRKSSVFYDGRVDGIGNGKEVIKNNGAEVNDSNQCNKAGIFERVQLSQETQWQNSARHKYGDPEASISQYRILSIIRE